LAVNPTSGWTATRPGAEDAACDQISRRWDSTRNVLVERERNFFLFEAADLGCASLIPGLLSSGASVLARDRAGNTAYLLAARKGHDAAVKILLESGAEPFQTNLAGSHALLMAVIHNRRKTARLLIDQGLDVDLANKSGVTPLVAACYNGNLRLVTMLLDAGADPVKPDASGKTGLVYAAGRGYLAIVRKLLETPDGLPVDARYANALTALMWAAGHSNDAPATDGLAIVDYLLSKGADPQLTDNRGRNALHIAAERNHRLVVERLIATGMPVSETDSNGLSAADLASDPVVRSLLESAGKP
jgi:ankyrin repeat protein